MTREEAYEPFYQFLREPSNSEKWKALRDLVDNLMTETERDTVDLVLEIIDEEQEDQLKRSNMFQALAAHDALGCLADRVKGLRGEEE